MDNQFMRLLAEQHLYISAFLPEKKKKSNLYGFF